MGTFHLHADFREYDGAASTTTFVTIYSAADAQFVDGTSIFETAKTPVVDGILDVDLPANDVVVGGYVVVRQKGVTTRWSVPAQNPGATVDLKDFTEPGGEELSASQYAVIQAQLAAKAAAHDADTAALVADENSDTATALSASYAVATKDLRGDVMLGLVAALESGTQSCGVAVMSDSTGVPDTSWPYLLAEHIADTYPALTVQTMAWNHGNQDFDRPIAIQTGAAGARAIVMNATSPTSATLRFTPPTGDWDIRIKLALPDWTPSSTLFLLKHWNADTLDNAFILRMDTDGKPQITWYPTGNIGTGKTAAADTAVPFSNGSTGWIRVTHDIDNGASGNDVKWYTSTDGSTWTQLGATITNAGGTAVTTHYASTREYELGPAAPLTKFYEIEIRNGINGPSVCPRLPEHWNRTIGTGPYTIEGAPVVTFTMGAKNGEGIGYDDNAATMTGYLNDATRLPKLLPDFGTLALFFNTGINEYELGGVTWTQRLSAWVAAAKAYLPGADPIVLTSVPVVHPTYSSGPRKRRPWTLAYGQRSAGTVHVIDTAQAMLDDGRALSGTLLGVDDVHPTTEGYIVMASPIIANFDAARQRLDFQTANGTD